MALSKGFRPLADQGIARVLDGSTTISEVSRAVDLTGRYT
jgi:type II secretory ATPase GspE/PulE/Tfp pilus assembly ATPase PilB-like protein